MKYFSALLLTGFISFNIPSTYGATTPGKENPEQPQPTSPPAKQTENTEGTPQTNEEITAEQPPKPENKDAAPPTQQAENADGKPQAKEGATTAARAPRTEGTTAPATPPTPLLLTGPTDKEPKDTQWKDPFTQQEQLYLEDTRIGRAVMEGNIEEYKAALAELTKIFNTPLFDILKKRTSNGENLLDLMITTEKNREYFASEMFHLLVLKTLSKQGLPAIQEVQLLLERAHQANNELSIRLLSSLETVLKQHETDYKEMTAQHTEESINLREQIIELTKRRYSKTKIAINTGLATAGGALSIWGYKLLTQASPNVVSPVPQIAEMLSTVSDKEVAIGAMAIGVGIAAKGAHKCVRTFMQRRRLNRAQRDLNRERPASF